MDSACDRRRTRAFDEKRSTYVSGAASTLHLVTTNADVRQQTLTDLAAAVDQADSPLDRLAALRTLRDAVTALEADSVDQARAGNHPWSQVAASLGVSKQAAQRRFTPKDDPQTTQEPTERPVRERKPVEWDITTRRGRTLFKVRKTQ